MGAPRVDDMLSFSYKKTGAQISKGLKEKIKFLKDKINERAGRIAKIRKDYDITDKDLIEIYSKTSQNNSMLSNAVTYTKMIGEGKNAKVEERNIAIGIITNIQSEDSNMQQEKKQLKRCELILRNINCKKQYNLDENEIEYLGF